MSKKDKSKFHKRLRAEILKQMEEVKTEKPTPTLTQEPIQKPVVEPPIEQEITKKTTSRVIPATSAIAEPLQLIRADLKKSAIIIGSIIIIIIVLFIVDQKTGILLKASNTIFKALNIGV